MKLYAKDGSLIKIGSVVQVSKGVRAEVRAMYQPHYPQSTGRVLLRFADGSDCDYSADKINAEWKE